jgi:acyl-[acyl-carrier-protein]-phospholipid O-acyltransferase/long-chain-fatty-acid--[acyl-carrier-protein] ligase
MLAALSDRSRVLSRLFHRVQIENLTRPAQRVIAPNHISFLDAGLAMLLRSRKPVFAIDVGTANWWKPFLHLRAPPIDR